MAKKKSGWNSLTPTQQANWKAENFSKSIKVSESTIKGLRAGKTFEGNVAKFKNGATAEEREAMNRFYGKTRVNTALGSTVTNINKTYPNPYKVSPGKDFKGVGQNNYTPPKTVKGPARGGTGYALPKASGFGSMAGDFVQNELLGVDDFKRAYKYGKEKNIKKATKSYVTGVGELGLTVGGIALSFFTGGAAGGALVAGKTALTGAKAITAGKTAKAITTGKKAPKAITAGPRKPLALPVGPVGQAAVKSAALDAKYAAASARAKAASAAHQKAMKQQKKGLLSSGEVRAVKKTAELERINVGIIANKARASRGLKPLPIKVGPVFQKPTTARNVAKPAGSGRTKASDLPTSKPKPAGKAPKTAKKAPTPKQRQKANTTAAKDMRRAIAPGSGRVTPAGSRSRVGDAKTEATRDRLIARLEKKGPDYRQELRSKYAGGRNTEQRAWEKRVTKQGGGPKSGASVTAASRDAAKRGVDVTVGKSKEAAKAARPKKVAKKTTKKTVKKTTTRGKK